MVKIYGRSNSANVQKVLWVCEELSIPVQREVVGGESGGMKTRDPSYLVLNPNGLVPTIDDDGFVLWESNAIVRYFAAKHGAGTLWPENVQERADADRWMDWASMTIAPAMGPLFVGLVRTPPEKRDPAALDEARHRALDAWKILSNDLSRRDFVAGSHFTMGDIALGVHAYRWFNLPIQRPSMMVGLQNWYARLTMRPAYKKWVMTTLT